MGDIETETENKMKDYDHQGASVKAKSSLREVSEQERPAEATGHRRSGGWCWAPQGQAGHE